MITDADIENIKQAADDIYRRLPSLHQLVDCYLQIFICQEMFARHNQAKVTAQTSSGNGFSPDFDLPACRRLLLELCRLNFAENQTLAQSGAGLAEAVESGKLAAKELFDLIIARDLPGLEKLSAGLDMDPVLLGFWGYHGLRPTLVQAAALAAKNNDNPTDQGSSACPVCGAPPALGSIEQDGSRRLHCSFCWNTWRIKRLACPFCNSGKEARNLYFYDENLPEWRVDVCQNCRTYLKTVDLRKLKRFFYPPLENIASLALDLKAEEENFKTANRGWLPGMFS